jgi:hypothetical protein
MHQGHQPVLCVGVCGRWVCWHLQLRVTKGHGLQLVSSSPMPSSELRCGRELVLRVSRKRYVACQCPVNQRLGRLSHPCSWPDKRPVLMIEVKVACKDHGGGAMQLSYF